MYLDVLKLKFPETFIETGTGKGQTLINLQACFRHLWSIELSLKRYTHVDSKLHFPFKVHLLFGDSVFWLDELLNNLQQVEGSAFFFLDAHYSGGDSAKGEYETPVLQELEILSTRTQNDMIVIDDYRNFGYKGRTGGSKHSPLHSIDWSEVTHESCCEALGDFKESYVIDDRLVFLR